MSSEAVLAELLADLLGRGEAARWNESWKYDPAAYAQRAAKWRELAAVAGRLREATAAEPPPDARIADAIEQVLLVTPGDHWFRVEDVAHVIGRMPPDPTAPDEPSFADHALALLARHTSNPDRLLALADRLMVEASCNEAEMAERLRTLAAELAAGARGIQ